MKEVKRKDSKNRVLKEGEVQRADGRYQFTMRDPITNERKTVYSWKLLVHDPMPAGKRPDKSLREKEKELMQKEFNRISLDGGGLNVSELVARYVSSMSAMRPSTQAGYRTVMNWLDKDPFGKRRISEINVDEAKQWIVSLQRVYGKSYSAIHSIRGVVRPAFQYAVDADLIRKNPFNFTMKNAIINDSVRREAVEPRDERRFLEFIRKDETYCKYYDAILILFKTGLRLGELCGLTIHDIDLENDIISINHQLQYNAGYGKNAGLTKTECGTRRLPMTEEVYQAFIRVINRRREIKSNEVIDGYKDFLFVDEHGKVMVGYQWEKVFQHIIEKHNKLYKDELPKITPHMCRHTYCTRMAISGININTLSYLMGHSSIEVTADVYTHINEKHAKVELDKVKEELLKLDKESDKIISMPNMA